MTNFPVAIQTDLNCGIDYLCTETIVLRPFLYRDCLCVETTPVWRLSLCWDHPSTGTTSILRSSLYCDSVLIPLYWDHLHTETTSVLRPPLYWDCLHVQLVDFGCYACVPPVGGKGKDGQPGSVEIIYTPGQKSAPPPTAPKPGMIRFLLT